MAPISKPNAAPVPGSFPFTLGTPSPPRQPHRHGMVVLNNHQPPPAAALLIHPPQQQRQHDSLSCSRHVSIAKLLAVGVIGSVVATIRQNGLAFTTWGTFPSDAQLNFHLPPQYYGESRRVQAPLSPLELPFADGGRLRTTNESSMGGNEPLLTTPLRHESDRLVNNHNKRNESAMSPRRDEHTLTRHTRPRQSWRLFERPPPPRVIGWDGESGHTWSVPKVDRPLQQQRFNTPDRLHPPAAPPRIVIADNNHSNVTNTTTARTQPVERRHWPEHEIFGSECKPMYHWQSLQFSICNDVHGYSFVDALEQDSLALLSTKGFWRAVWKTKPPVVNNSFGEEEAPLVWKNLKLEHSYEPAYFENNRVDALAMERLTSSPYIMNIYAFCGMSVVTEFADTEVATAANELSSKDKLKLAIQASQGVADMHGICDNPEGHGNSSTVDGPVSFVHNDMNLANLVIARGNRPVWNDFNVAVLMMQRETKRGTSNITVNETCKFLAHFPNPQWKAPEEQPPNFGKENVTEEDLIFVTEKVDIYALGNLFYRLAVRRSPWKLPGMKRMTLEEKTQVARLKRLNGTRPGIPDEIQEAARSDPALFTLLQAMDLTYRFRPENRPTAKALVAFLQRAYNEILRDERMNSTRL